MRHELAFAELRKQFSNLPSTSRIGSVDGALLQLDRVEERQNKLLLYASTQEDRQLGLISEFHDLRACLDTDEIRSKGKENAWGRDAGYIRTVLEEMRDLLKEAEEWDDDVSRTAQVCELTPFSLRDHLIIPL